MKKLAFALGVLFACSLSYGIYVNAQAITNPAPVGNAAAYNSVAPTCTDGQFCYMQTDVNGNLKVAVSSTGTTTQQVVGNVANAATDSGNPVKVGGIYNTAPGTLTNGQRGDLQLGNTGSAKSQLMRADSNTAITSFANLGSDAITTSQVTLGQSTFSFKFNGASWDRDFTCPNQATINVTAGNTATVVTLSGSTVIRVCSVMMSMSATGQVAFVTGTGSNCGTPTPIGAPFTLNTGIPLTLSGGNNSIMRGTAGGQLCVSATTGNAQGFLTYAQY